MNDLLENTAMEICGELDAHLCFGCINMLTAVKSGQQLTPFVCVISVVKLVCVSITPPSDWSSLCKC
jgi:hypothetical protein